MPRHICTRRNDTDGCDHFTFTEIMRDSYPLWFGPPKNSGLITIYQYPHDTGILNPHGNTCQSAATRPLNREVL